MARNNYISKKTQGARFPFVPDPATGSLKELDTTAQSVHQDIVLFMKTERRSRIMRPSLGVRLRSRLGDPLIPEIRNQIASTIQRELQREFQDVKVLEVNLGQPDPMKFDIEVKYELKQNVDNSPPNVVNITIQ